MGLAGRRLVAAWCACAKPRTTQSPGCSQLGDTRRLASSSVNGHGAPAREAEPTGKEVPGVAVGHRAEMDLVIDILLVACLVLTALAGLSHGFFRELFSVCGLAAGIIVGLRLATPILERAPEWLRRSGLAWGILFTLLFAAVYGALAVAGRALALAWEGKKPTGLSRLLGLVLGGARGFALVLFLAGALVMLAPPERAPLARSRVLPRLDSAMRAAAGLVLPPPARARVLGRWDRLPFRKTGVPAGQPSQPGESI
jgi:membrane protein required for colicin V production